MTSADWGTFGGAVASVILLVAFLHIAAQQTAATPVLATRTLMQIH